MGDTFNKRPDEFVKLFLDHQHRLLAFTSVLVPTLSDAEDVLQDATAVMWEKFDTFEVGSNYTAWAFKIIRYKVLEWRRKFQNQKVVFDESLLDDLIEDLMSMDHFEEPVHLALNECVAMLPQLHQDIIRMRFKPEGTLAATAKSIGRSVVTTRKYLNQILNVLLNCVTNKITGGV